MSVSSQNLLFKIGKSRCHVDRWLACWRGLSLQASRYLPRDVELEHTWGRLTCGAEGKDAGGKGQGLQ